MTIAIHLGWWLAPLVVTGAAFVWAIAPRGDEEPDGSMFSGVFAAIALAVRLPCAAAGSLLVWLVWSLAV